MKFHSHPTLFESMPREVKRCGLNEFYWHAYEASRDEMISHIADNSITSDFRVFRVIAERDWYSRLRPYYKVWPSFTDCLRRIRLDVRLSELGLEGNCICIRFAEGQEPASHGIGLRTILAAVLAEQDGRSFIAASVGLVGGVERANFKVGLFGYERTIDEEIAATGSNDGFDAHGIVEEATKILLTVLLLGHDPSIVKPDVLADDRKRFDETGDQKYVEKAKRRGIVGWRIGEEYESIPHYRRPHFGLRHTGPGRTVPRIVPIKGAVVHRDKLTRVPTGYITPDGVEVEP